MALKALESVYRTNGAAVEGLADITRHRRKLVGKGKSVSWGGARTKGEFCECKLTKKMFFHSHLLMLCHTKICNITEFFPDTTVFYDYKTCVANQRGGNGTYRRSEERRVSAISE